MAKSVLALGSLHNAALVGALEEAFGSGIQTCAASWNGDSSEQGRQDYQEAQQKLRSSNYDIFVTDDALTQQGQALIKLARQSGMKVIFDATNLAITGADAYLIPDDSRLRSVLPENALIIHQVNEIEKLVAELRAA